MKNISNDIYAVNFPAVSLDFVGQGINKMGMTGPIALSCFDLVRDDALHSLVDPHRGDTVLVLIVLACVLRVVL